MAGDAKDVLGRPKLEDVQTAILQQQRTGKIWFRHTHEPNIGPTLSDTCQEAMG